jgi:hypothetical protein
MWHTKVSVDLSFELSLVPFGEASASTPIANEVDFPSDSAFSLIPSTGCNGSSSCNAIVPHTSVSNACSTSTKESCLASSLPPTLNDVSSQHPDPRTGQELPTLDVVYTGGNSQGVEAAATCNPVANVNNDQVSDF